jgi:DNA-binding transcriptional LysR family regulator
MEKIRIDDLSLWESFYWVSRKNSFTAAAKQLRMSVAFLSKKIGRLEELMGARLFNRTTRRVSMTEEARQLFPRVEALLEEMAQIENVRGAAEEAGLIRLTCVPAFAQRRLPALLVAFQKLHPRVYFELNSSDALVDLVDSQMDMAIRVQRPVGAEFVFRKLVENELVWVATPEYLASHPKIRKPSDLKDHALLTLTVYRHCRVGEKLLVVQDLLQNEPLRCESGTILTELALHGSGVALRSLWDVAPLMKEGKLARILREFPVDGYGAIYAVTPHSRFVTRRVRLFLDFLAAAV